VERKHFPATGIIWEVIIERMSKVVPMVSELKEALN